MVLRRNAVPKMQALEYDYVGMADECINEGCPVDKLEDLIDLLKKEDIGIVGEIKMAELEALLAGPRPDKNEVEKVVEDLSSIVRMFIGGTTGRGPAGAPLKAPEKQGTLEWGNAKVPSPKVTAAQCLESGCSIDMMEGLVVELSKDPTADPEMVAELGRLLVEKEKNQNALEKIVRKMGEAFNPSQSLKSLTVVSQKAADCLEAGCPVDLVDDLLATMESESDQSPEVLQAIKELKAYRPKARKGIGLEQGINYLLKLCYEAWFRKMKDGPTVPLKPWSNAWKYDRKTTSMKDWTRYR